MADIWEGGSTPGPQPEGPEEQPTPSGPATRESATAEATAEELGEQAANAPVGCSRAAALTQQAQRISSEPDGKEQAVALWRRTLVNDPDHPTAQDALLEHATSSEDWVLLSWLQQRRFQSAAPGSARAEIARGIAHIEHKELYNPASARQWLLRGLEEAPDHASLHEALIELERDRGDERALVKRIEDVIRLRRENVPVALLLEAAERHADRGDRHRALTLLERASAQAPEEASVLDGLLVQLRALSHYPELADALERRAALAESDPRQRAERLSELGTLFESRLFDNEAALDAYQRALEAAPDTHGLREAVDRLHAKQNASNSLDDADTDRVSGVLAAYEREAAATHDRERLGVLAREIERLHGQRGTSEQAIPSALRWVDAAPEEPKALRTLARLQERTGQSEALIETLQSLDRLLEPDAQIVVRRRIAVLCGEAGRLADSEYFYTRALRLDPTDLASLEGRVEALKQREEQCGALIEALVALADQQSGSERFRTISEIADLHEVNDDPMAAIAALQGAESDPDCPSELTQRLDELLGRTSRTEELAQRLEQRLSTCDPGSSEAVALDLQRAHLLLDELERPDEAAELFRRVLQHAPEATEASAGLERALRTGVDASALAVFLAEQLESTESDEERDRLAYEHAVLLEEMLDEPEQALERFQQLAAESTVEELQQASARHSEALLEQLGHWAELRDQLRIRLENCAEADEAPLRERLANLCSERLDDDNDALQHFERVVELEPERSDLWQVLAGRYEVEGRTEDWARALEAQLACDPAPERELGLRSKLADLYGNALGQPDRLRPHYERIFALNPSNPVASRYLIEYHESEGRYDEVTAVLEAELAHSEVDAHDDPLLRERSAALRLQIASIRETQLGDLEGAIAVLEAAYGEAGPTPQVAEPLASAYRRAGFDTDLIELCKSASATAEEPADRATWLIRLGDAHLARDEASHASDAYRKALTERPGDRAVEASLRELYRALDRRDSLAELLENELEHLAGAAEIPVRLELVELLKQENPQTAFRHARRILELAPRHADAYEAALALCPRPEDKLELVEERHRAARSAQERREAGLERARLLAGPLARTDEAVTAYHELLGAEPGGPRSREIRTELAKLLERSERHAEWLDLWATICRDMPAEQRAEQIDRAVVIAWDRLSPEAALPWLERLRVERPDDPDVRRRISHACRQVGSTPALLRALLDEAEAVPDANQASRCHLERARLLHASGTRGRALAALEAAGPSSEGLRLREVIEGELGLHSRQATTLEALLAIPGADVGLHERLAELYSGPLCDPASALPHWEAALAGTPAGPTRVESLRSLASAHLQLGRLDEWARFSEEELESLDATPVFDDRRRTLRRELALAYSERLARPDPALAHLRALLDGPDVEMLGTEDRDRLELGCIQLLRAGGRRVELERRLGQRLERCGGDAEAWLELARLREETLHRIGAAREAQRRALEVEPGHRDALRGLRRTTQQLGLWSDLARALEQEIEVTEDTTERGALFRALGDLCWHRLDSTTRASRYYAAALEANASDFAALRALERLLEAMEDWRGAIDLYASEAEALGSANPRRRREIWLRVAALAAERADDPERARRAFDEAARIAALEPEHLREHAEVCARSGDQEAFASSFSAWCDAPDSEPEAADQLRLAETLEQLGRPEEALARVEMAIEADPESADAWQSASRLRAASGDGRASAAALQRAAAHLSCDEAAERLLEAAGCLPDDDPSALDLLRTATERAPLHLPAQAARARVAARQGQLQETERAAVAVVEAEPSDALDASETAAIAQLGAEAAHQRGRIEAAADLYAEALKRDPGRSEALAGYAQILIALGDYAAAREPLERRLSDPGPNPDRSVHRALLGRCLEQAEQPEEALNEYNAALEIDPTQTDALEACARIHERQGDFERGIAAIERWARAAPDATTRAERLLRAADWELRRGGSEAAAEAHLRAIVAADPEQTRGWIALSELQLAQGRLDEVVESSDRAASHAREPAELAALAEIQGRAREARGERREAVEHFALAWDCDPRRASAALAQARLLRGFGEWREAADALGRFADDHPDRADADLADVFEQLGRLRAGPLEDLDGAVLSYRRAIELSPERREARAALAELLSHRPGDWDEALSHLGNVLEAEPTHTGCLRVALRIARGRAQPELVATGILLQRALGIASAYEREEDAEQAAPLISTEPSLENPLFETLRRLSMEASRELASALQGTEAHAEEATTEDLAATLRERMLTLQGELSAAALLAPSSEGAGEALGLLVELLLEPEQVRGDGHLVNGLSGALSRRRRRKLRKLLPEDAKRGDYAQLDYGDWRTELQALAAAEMLRRDDVTLHQVMAVLVAEPGEAVDLEAETPLAPLVEDDPVARSLFRRVVRDWLQRI